MPKWKLVIEYEGTRYRGWQEQINARTVQGEVREAAEDVLGQKIEIMGSGRTDAGVHALCQVAHIRSLKTIPTALLRQEINDRLPSDIHVRELTEAHSRFHARHDAEERFYLYQISTERSAFGKHFVWWIKDRLHVKSMREAFSLFRGMHDFDPYRERAEDSTSTMVNMTCCELAVDGNLILLRIGASHFLWKMVRRIVGVVAAVGRGRIRIQDIDRLNRTDIAEITAPPSGLFLEYVRYPGDNPIGPLVPAFAFRQRRNEIEQ